MSLQNGSILLSGHVEFSGEAIREGLNQRVLGVELKKVEKPTRVLGKCIESADPDRCVDVFVGDKKMSVDRVCAMCSSTEHSAWFTAGDGLYRCGECQAKDPRPKCERCKGASVEQDDTLCKQCRLIVPKVGSLSKVKITSVHDKGTAYHVPSGSVRRGIVAEMEHVFMTPKERAEAFSGALAEEDVKESKSSAQKILDQAKEGRKQIMIDCNVCVEAKRIGLKPLHQTSIPQVGMFQAWCKECVSILKEKHDHKSEEFDIKISLIQSDTGTTHYDLLGVIGSVTVREVLEKVAIHEQVNMYKATAIYAGKKLENGKTLSEYNICKESTIHILIPSKAERTKKMKEIARPTYEFVWTKAEHDYASCILSRPPHKGYPEVSVEIPKLMEDKEVDYSAYKTDECNISVYDEDTDHMCMGTIRDMEDELQSDIIHKKIVDGMREIQIRWDTIAHLHFVGPEDYKGSCMPSHRDVCGQKLDMSTVSCIKFQDGSQLVLPREGYRAVRSDTDDEEFFLLIEEEFFGPEEKKDALRYSMEQLREIGEQVKCDNSEATKKLDEPTRKEMDEWGGRADPNGPYFLSNSYQLVPGEQVEWKLTGKLKELLEERAKITDKTVDELDLSQDPTSYIKEIGLKGKEEEVEFSEDDESSEGPPTLVGAPVLSKRGEDDMASHPAPSSISEPERETEEERLIRMREAAAEGFLNGQFESYYRINKELKELYERTKEIRTRMGEMSFHMKEEHEPKILARLGWECNELYIELTRLVGPHTYNKVVYWGK